MKTVIFDIDGTLADCSHRLHYVRGSNRDWASFFALMHQDTIHEPIRDLLSFLVPWPTVDIVLCSGRPETYRETTEIWLRQHGIRWDALYMRPAGDQRADHVVKRELLDRMRADGYEPFLVIDDRPTVVAMWREAGLTCLQCREWDEQSKVEPGLLTLMVGPSGAGKSTWLRGDAVFRHFSKSPSMLGVHYPSHVVSSDQIRADLCGDFFDQTRNDDVFTALHAIVKARVSNGLPAVVDATNLRRKDRLACVSLTTGRVRYIVIDRPMTEKYRGTGWRKRLTGADGAPFDLIAKHAQTFASQLSDILAGDGLPNVEVVDLRRSA